MKFPSLFTKAPSHKRFNYQPRWYDAQEEERKEREARIKQELQAKGESEEAASYRSRIAGSFKNARRTNRQGNTSAALLRTLILLFLVVWLIAYLEFGKPALYALVLFVPIYLYLKFKKG